jgi:predicted nuclease of predicted toxin-antitoxin system
VGGRLDNATHTQAGYDTIHVGELGLAAASDEEIFALAAAEDRVILSADTVFGALLALWKLSKPSFVLLRGATPRRPTDQTDLLIANLPAFADDLLKGAVVVISPGRIRVRSLPISEE